MTIQLTSFLLTVLLGIISTIIGMVLYKYGEAIIKYKGARFGGAVAIAGMAFYLMGGFYFQQVKFLNEQSLKNLDELKIVVHEYETCRAHEPDREALECKYQIDKLLDSVKEILE